MRYELFFDAVKKYFNSMDESLILNHHKESIEHMLRCSEMARDFGVYLKLNDYELEKLLECALLHDLGKLQLNPNILYKDTKLTDEEFNYIKTHTSVINEGLLDECILDCIHYHHDNVVGTGYNKINVSSKHEFVRIISLIDCYDAMSHKRCYKNFVLNTQEIIDDIENLIGKQFDYYYGHKFINFLNENKLQALSYIS